MEAFHSEIFSFYSAALPNTAFYIAQFEGTEALNTLFNFELKLLCEDADIDTEALIGTRAVFTIHRKKGGDAVYSGDITQIVQSGSIHGYTYYQVSLRPSFARLKLLVNSAVFLDCDLKQTIEKVINRESFFHLDYEFRLAGTHPKKEFAMQYNESSFEYILWRLIEEGAYFYFDKNGERVIFADNPMSHALSEGTVFYSPISGLEHSVIDEVITSLTLDQALLPARVVVRTYHWQDPNKMLTGIAEVSKKGTGDVYLSNEEADSQEDAERIAKIRAEQILAAGRIFRGSGYVPFLRPGTVFTLAMHPTEEFNRDYIVTKIRHEGRQETLLSIVLGIPIDSEPEHFFYRNSFECIESNIKYVSYGAVNRAVIPATIRAFIDGDVAGEPLMDKYGRYKVLFPFDVSGRSGGKASCWIRRAQEQVGKDFGAAFPLVPGTEVLISFINGNPDWPVINGALANGETGSISTGANSHLWGIRTGGGPQITFNNKNNGIQLANVTGSEIAMGSGSLGYFRTSTHIGLKTAASSFSDIGGFFADNMTGFVYRRRAICSSVSQYLSLATVAAGKAGQKIYEGLSEKSADPNEPLQDWGATATKLIPLIAFLDPPPYNIRISASKKNSSVRMQCFPSVTELLINIGLIILMRGSSIGTETSDGKKNPNTKEQNFDITSYTEALEKSMQAIYDAGVIEEYIKYNGQAKSNLHKEVNVGEYFTDAKNVPCKYYEQVITAMDNSIRIIEMNIEDAASEENIIAWTECINKLKACRVDLDSAYEKNCEGNEIKKTEVFDENLKNNVKRNKFIVQALGLLPEIGVIVAVAIWQLRLKKKIGGIMIDAQDKNINIHAKSYIGIHAERGIYLNSSQAICDRKNPRSGDKGLWGVSAKDFEGGVGVLEYAQAQENPLPDENIYKIFDTIEYENAEKKPINNPVPDRPIKKVGDLLKEGHCNLRNPKTGAAVEPESKDNTFIAEDTKLSYMHSQTTIYKIDNQCFSTGADVYFRFPNMKTGVFHLGSRGISLTGSATKSFSIYNKIGGGQQFRYELANNIAFHNYFFNYGFLKSDRNNHAVTHGIFGNRDGICLQQIMTEKPSRLELAQDHLTFSACEGEEEASLILTPNSAVINAETVVLGDLVVTKNDISVSEGGVLEIGDVLKVTEDVDKSFVVEPTPSERGEVIGLDKESLRKHQLEVIRKKIEEQEEEERKAKELEKQEMDELAKKLQKMNEELEEEEGKLLIANDLKKKNKKLDAEIQKNKEKHNNNKNNKPKNDNEKDFLTKTKQKVGDFFSGIFGAKK